VTKHQMVTMRLHRNGVILAVLLALVMAILIFAAGYLTATIVRKPEVRRVVVNAPAAAPAKPAAKPAKTTTPVTIRAGAFATEDEAKALVQKLAANQFESRIVSSETEEGTALFLVLVGSYATRDEAMRDMSRMEQNVGINAAIIPAPAP